MKAGTSTLLAAARRKTKQIAVPILPSRQREPPPSQRVVSSLRLLPAHQLRSELQSELQRTLYQVRLLLLQIQLQLSLPENLSLQPYRLTRFEQRLRPAGLQLRHPPPHRLQNHPGPQPVR